MVHHSAHPRTITLTVPRIPVRRLKRAARRFEQKCARHWAFTAYALLTAATFGYVVHELTTI